MVCNWVNLVFNSELQLLNVCSTISILLHRWCNIQSDLWSIVYLSIIDFSASQFPVRLEIGIHSFRTSLNGFPVRTIANGTKFTIWIPPQSTNQRTTTPHAQKCRPVIRISGRHTCRASIYKSPASGATQMRSTGSSFAAARFLAAVAAAREIYRACENWVNMRAWDAFCGWCRCRCRRRRRSTTTPTSTHTHTYKTRSSGHTCVRLWSFPQFVMSPRFTRLGHHIQRVYFGVALVVDVVVLRLRGLLPGVGNDSEFINKLRDLHRTRERADGWMVHSTAPKCVEMPVFVIFRWFFPRFFCVFVGLSSMKILCTSMKVERQSTGRMG